MSFGMKPQKKRKRPVRKPPVRWDLLGLHNLAVPALPTMEEIRREIILAAHHGLGEESRSRSQVKDATRN